jgi:hypothetical protein
MLLSRSLRSLIGTLTRSFGQSGRALLQARARSRRSLPSRSESLEDRTLLSAFYDLETLASTSDQFTSIGNLVAINNSSNLGTVAFSATTAQGSGIYTTDGHNGIKLVNPSFASSPTRDFGLGVAINDAGQITARDRSSIGSATDHVRIWQVGAAEPNDTRVAQAPDTTNGFSALQAFTDINNQGDVVYVAQSSDGVYRSIQFESHDNIDPNASVTVAFMQGAGRPSSKPQLTDDGRVLFYSSNTLGGSIKLATITGNSVTTEIIGDSLGIVKFGSDPGISSDGRIIVFSGQKADGTTAIYASYMAGGVRQYFRIAGGEDSRGHLDDFKPFDLTTAVRVNNTLATERGVTIVFQGNSASVGEGIYSTRLSFFPPYVGSFDPDNPVDPDQLGTVQVGGILPVALVNDAVGSGAKIQSVSLWDGINDINRGEIAFWAEMNDGSQQIIRATEMQVVWVDFNPLAQSFGGVTYGNLKTLEGLGLRASDGENLWTGSTESVLRDMGLDINYDAFRADVVNAVQSFYTSATVDVRILSGTEADKPKYVPNPMLKLTGERILDPDGIDVDHGGFQTVYVGGAPAEGNLGYAAIGLAGTGGVDYFNALYDDFAFAFVNNIYNPYYFHDRSVTAISSSERIGALADTIAHEIGHNLGLFHLDEDLTAQLMHGATRVGEFEQPQTFSSFPLPVENSQNNEALNNVTESSLDRLVFAAGSRFYDIDKLYSVPNPALIVSDVPNATAKLGVTLTGSPITVHDLVIGVVNAGADDLLPVYYDLGGGDLATLLANANIPISVNDSVIVLGSTTGTTLDIVGTADNLAVGGTFTATNALAISSDPRLRLPVTATATDFKLFDVLGATPASLGSITVQATDPNQPPVIGPISSRDVTPGTMTTFTVTATDPDAGQTLAYSLDPGAPSGASINPTTGVFTWTPTASQAGQSVSITVRVTDNGNPAASSAQSFVVNVSNALSVTAVTWITPPAAGALQVAIDFNEALNPTSAQNGDLYSIYVDGSPRLPIQSAAYSDANGHHRVLLTVPAGTEITPSQYHVGIDGAKLVAVNGDRAAADIKKIWTVSPDGTGLASVVTQPDGTVTPTGETFNFGIGTADQFFPGDFTGDGISDLVVTVASPPGVFRTLHVYLLAGLSGGTYADPELIPFGDGLQFPSSLFITDWNGDHKPDIVGLVYEIVNQQYTGNYNYFVLQNDGQGHFSDASSTPIPAISTASGFFTQLVDVTGDGLPEIVEWNNNSAYAVPDLMVIGKDPFLGYNLIETIPVRNIGDFDSIQTADLNGDGKLDFITRGYGFYGNRPGVSVIMSTPTGYDDHTIFQGYGAPIFVSVGDYDHDGHPDILTMTDDYDNSFEVNDGDVLRLLKGDGHGNFTTKVLDTFGRVDLGVPSIADLDGDGLPDLHFQITPSTDVGGHGFDFVDQTSGWTLLGRSNGTFVPATPEPVALPASVTGIANDVVSADLDGDGFLDEILGTNSKGEIVFAINDGTGTLHVQPPTLSLGFESTGKTYFADFNNDGLLDFVTVDIDDGFDIYLAKLNGGFRLTDHLPKTLVGPLSDPKFGDLNNDGTIDIVGEREFGDATLAVFLGNGDGTFRYGPTPSVVGIGTGATGFSMGDLNNDGNLDAIVAFSNGQYTVTTFGVLFGDGTGALYYNPNSSFNMTYAEYLQPVVPILADFNGDGKLDVIAGTTESDGVTRLRVRLGNGNGTFRAGPVISSTTSYSGEGFGFLVGDFTGDGKLDLLQNFRGTGLYRGDGKGGFVLDTSVQAPDNIRSVGDFNDDGKLDLTQFDPSTNVWSILTGDGTGHFTASRFPSVILGVAPLVPILDVGTISIPDQAPVAQDDHASVATGKSIVIPVLINDSDPDHESVKIASVTSPAHGVAHVVDTNNTPDDPTDDTIVYGADVGYIGTDSFTYTITDNAGAQATATVTVTVVSNNHPPVANADQATGITGTAISVAVLTNDTDTDHDALTLASVGVPAHGSAVINRHGTPNDPSDDTITYTPTAGYVGVDSFVYTISDVVGATATATVSVTVKPTNRAPVAVNDAAAVVAGSSVSVAVLANDTDLDNDVLTIATVGQPAHGIAQIDQHGTPGNPADDTIAYAPSSGYIGTDSFAYTITDTLGATATATVIITVQAAGANHNPVAVNDTATTSHDTLVNIAALQNDRDPDGDAIKLTSVTNPTHGLVVINQHGTPNNPADDTLDYTPAVGFVGTDSFSYTIGDTSNALASATVTVTVTEVSVDLNPHLTIGGSAVTWISKHAPVNILPQVTVTDAASLAGGTLTINVNAIGSTKKALDLYGMPSASALGTTTGAHYASGRVTLQVVLNQNITPSAIESFLRGLTFATKGKGLKTLTRNMNVTLADAAGHSTSLSQTVNVRKKA